MEPDRLRAEILPRVPDIFPYPKCPRSVRTLNWRSQWVGLQPFGIQPPVIWRVTAPPLVLIPEYQCRGCQFGPAPADMGHFASLDRFWHAFWPLSGTETPLFLGFDPFDHGDDFFRKGIVTRDQYPVSPLLTPFSSFFFNVANLTLSHRLLLGLSCL